MKLKHQRPDGASSASSRVINSQHTEGLNKPKTADPEKPKEDWTPTLSTGSNAGLGAKQTTLSLKFIVLDLGFKMQPMWEITRGSVIGNLSCSQGRRNACEGCATCREVISTSTDITAFSKACFKSQWSWKMPG